MLVTLVVFAGYAYAAAVFRDRVLGAPRARRWIERTIGAAADRLRREARARRPLTLSPAGGSVARRPGRR